MHRIEKEFFTRNSLWLACRHCLLGISAPRWLLIGLVVFAIGMRLPLTSFGLPLLIYPEEAQHLDHALRFSSSSDMPPLFIYFFSGIAYLLYLYTPFMAWEDYRLAMAASPTLLALMARDVMVVFSVAGIVLLAKIGRKAFSSWVGLAAAFLLSVNILHVQMSAVVLPDMLTLFCVLAAAWYALSVSEKGRQGPYLMCALMIALSICFSFRVFTVFFLIAAHCMRYNERRESAIGFWKTALQDRNFWLSLALIPLVFLVLNPPVWGDFSLLKHGFQPASGFRLSGTGILQNLSLLPGVLGWPALLAGLGGLILVLRKYRFRAAVLLSFPLAFIAVNLPLQDLPPRLLLLVTPFWCLLAALFLQDTVQGRLWPRHLPERYRLRVFTVLVLLTAWPMLLASARYVSYQASPKTGEIQLQKPLFIR